MSPNKDTKTTQRRRHDAAWSIYDRLAGAKGLPPRPQGRPGTHSIEQFTIELVANAYLSEDHGPRRALIDQALIDPPFARHLRCDVLPKVVQRVGNRWLNDSISFVDVTLATGRIQEVLRLLVRSDSPPADRGAIALIVPPWEQHTLAAEFAAQSLRDVGVAVRLLGGRDVARICANLPRMRTQAIMLSIGSDASRERAPDLIRRLQQASRSAVPVIVGGAIAEDRTGSFCPRGADLMTNDFSEALDFCKIPLVPPVEKVCEMSVE